DPRKNRRIRNPARLANVVFEEEAGQLRWRLFRFRASGLARTYEYGPRDRDHGLAESYFRDPLQKGDTCSPGPCTSGASRSTSGSPLRRSWAGSRTPWPCPDPLLRGEGSQPYSSRMARMAALMGSV